MYMAFMPFILYNTSSGLVTFKFINPRQMTGVSFYCIFLFMISPPVYDLLLTAEKSDLHWPNTHEFLLVERGGSQFA